MERRGRVAGEKISICWMDMDEWMDKDMHMDRYRWIEVKGEGGKNGGLVHVRNQRQELTLSSDQRLGRYLRIKGVLPPRKGGQWQTK